MASSNSPPAIPMQNMDGDAQAQQKIALAHISKISRPPRASSILIDVSLLYLATEFSEVESRVFIITTKIADNFPNTGIDVEELQDARSTLQNIRDGRMAFSDDYLKDNVLRTYWEKLALVYPEILRGWRQGDLLPGGIRHQMDTMLHCARRIPGILYYLAVTNKLSPEIREHLLRKWESLDEIGEAHERFFGSEISLPRTFALRDALESMIPTAKKWDTPGPEPVNKLNLHWTDFNSVLMLLGCIICNIVFISLGIHSKHSQKHNNSAFWFLLQGCILQDVGLTISVRTLWGEPSGRRSLWIIFTVIAFVFTTIAPILYYFIPIPFASVSALIGGAIQPLIIVSIATVKDARSED